MVSTSYMVAKRPGAPSFLAQIITQDALPWAVNAAGAVEGALYRCSEGTRARPLAAMLCALGSGALLGTAARLRRPARRR